MIGLVFAGVGILIAYNLGAIITEKRYERIIKEKETSYALTLGALSEQINKSEGKE